MRSLGLEGRAIPERAEEASALYRSLLAGRRILIMLDNVSSARQVVPLLPGSPGAAVIVTSRRSLTTLPGFRHVHLGPLSEGESVGLLAKVAGRTPAALGGSAEEAVALAGHLPLAIRLIGARLAARPSWPLQHLVEQLRDERRRLDEFDPGQSSVRASIESTLQMLAASDLQLDRQSAEALGRLGLLDCPDLSTVLTARVLDTSERQADALLENLVDLNLLESNAPGRYRLHDLIRTYARESVIRSTPAVHRHETVARVLRFYSAAAWSGHRLTHPTSPRLAYQTTGAEPSPDFTELGAALRWLDAELPSILGVFRQAAQSTGHHPAAIAELAAAMFGYLETRSRWPEMQELCRAGAVTADRGSQAHLAAWLTHDQAIPEVEHENLAAAREHLARSFEMFRLAADEAGQARASSSLCHVLEQIGDLDEALRWGQQAVLIGQRIGDPTLEGVGRLALGKVHNRRADRQAAEQAFEESIALARATGDGRSIAKRHQIAGESYLACRFYDPAVRLLLKGHQVFQELGDDSGQAECLRPLALTYAAMGEKATAEKYLVEGLRLTRAIGNRFREGQLLIELGKLRSAAADLSEASQYWSEAIATLHGVSPRDEAIASRLLAEVAESSAL